MRDQRIKEANGVGILLEHDCALKQQEERAGRKEQPPMLRVQAAAGDLQADVYAEDEHIDIVRQIIG